MTELTPCDSAGQYISYDVLRCVNTTLGSSEVKRKIPKPCKIEHGSFDQFAADTIGLFDEMLNGKGTFHAIAIQCTSTGR